jgi:ATP-binding cassette, subfamily B (MDR/TAP), member 1
VTFAYPLKPDKHVLKQANIHFAGGEMTFVVGRSGSGKSTIADLIVKFYEPQHGHILIDSISTQDIHTQWLRRNVLLVQQSSTLFTGSFANNVSLGSHQPRQVMRDQIKAACETVLLQSTINDMPLGLETQVGPGVYTLSGGQQQRLALARARLRDPAILILDEITSGLDPLSSKMIMDAIRQWRLGKTTIVITHDLAQMQENDYVYVIDNGTVVEKGACASLVSHPSGFVSSMVAARDESPQNNPGQPADEVPETHRRVDISAPNWLPSRFAQHANENNDFKRISLLAPLMSSSSTSRLRIPQQSVNDFGDKRSSLAVIFERGQSAQAERGNSTMTRRSHRSAEVEISAAGQKLEDEKETNHLRDILRTVWPALNRRERLGLLLGISASLTVAAGNPIFSFLFAQMLQAFWATGARESVGRKWAVLLLVEGAIDALAVFLSFYFLDKTGQAWVDTLRGESFKRLLRQPKAWFQYERNSPARIAESLDGHGEEMRKLIGVFAPILLIAVGMVSSSIIWALVISWDLSLVALAGGPVVVALTQWGSKVSDKCETESNKAAESTNAVFSEAFTNLRVVRALTLESYFAEELRASALQTFRIGLSRAWRTGLLFGVNQAASDWLAALIFYYGVRILSSPSNTLGVNGILHVVNLLLFSIGTAAAMLGNIPQIAAAKTAATQLHALAYLPIRASHEHKAGMRAQAILPIELSNLQFAYRNRADVLVLRNINLTIHPGEFLAIVGSSGGGKSTILSLLLQLYEPEDVSTCSSPTASTSHRNYSHPLPTSMLRYPPLSFAGISSRSLDTTSLRSHMAYVTQQPFLFPVSVRDNILFGQHDDAPARHDADARVRAAARAAGVLDLVESLPNGLDTVIGDGGLGLSGGEAQRICVARALARRPKLLVLDEPTSALDATSAEGIMQTLREYVVAGGGGTSVVVVTHSKEMMRVADRVAVVAEGVISATGAYWELLERDKGFRELVGEE